MCYNTKPMTNIETTSGTPEVNDKKVYEVSALLVPELETAELSQVIESVKGKLISLEAEIIEEGGPTHIQLAYTVEKHINNKIKRADYAHYYWVKFAVDPANIKAIETFFKLDLNEKSLRHLIIKTLRTKTMLTELSEARISDIKDDKLIDEVLQSDLKAEGEAEKLDDSNTTTDLGGDEPLKTTEDFVKEVEAEGGIIEDKDKVAA